MRVKATSAPEGNNRHGERRPPALSMGALVITAGIVVLILCSCITPAQKFNAPAHSSATQASATTVLKGRDALGDWRTDRPGVRRLITTADLDRPFATPSTDNGPNIVPRPRQAWPQAPPGFKVEEFATGLKNPRKIVTAPNGDLFVAESAAGRIRILRDTKGAGKSELSEVFVSGLRQPFGIAFYPPGPDPSYIYIANTDSIVRYPYRNGDTKARGPQEMIVPDIPGGGRLRGGGHWTRDIVFSKDGRKMFVSVGSHSNDSDDPAEKRRADILEYNPDGTGYRLYAWGIRNAVGIAINPQTGELWGSVNERDGLGDNLPPDYITHIAEGGFYGWPWYYLGPNWDPRHRGEHLELKDKVIVPDVLLQAHSASLEMTFYTGEQFPREYQGDAFAAEHGSWNRSRRTGYKVIRVPMRDGRATGEYEDFLTGFVVSDAEVWGRPVGVTVAKDGSLIVTDDGSNSIWRVSYVGGEGRQ